MGNRRREYVARTKELATAEFDEYLDQLWDRGLSRPRLVKGVNVLQLLEMYQSGAFCDEVDRFYLDHETIGGE